MKGNSFFYELFRLVTNFLILKIIKIIAHISIKAIKMTGIPFIIVLIELNLIFLTKRRSKSTSFDFGKPEKRNPTQPKQ